MGPSPSVRRRRRSLTWTSHGARLLSRLTGSARKYAETIELDTIRHSTGADRDTREGMVTGVRCLLKSLDRAVGVEDATKKGQVQEFFYKKLQDNPWLSESTSLRKLCET